MKRTSFLILLSLIAFIVVGCAGMSGVGKPSPTLERIEKRGSLLVGTAANMPPLNMTTKKGRMGGLDIDLAHLIAGAMGVELKLVKKNFSELLPALEAGEVDMVISGMTITPDRNRKVAFVGPYHITGKSVLTKTQFIAKAGRPEDLNSSKFHFTALAGSTSEQLVKDIMPDAKLTPVDNYDDGVAMVLNDQADAMVSDFHACLLAILRNQGAGLIPLMTPFTYEPLGIALPPGDSHLINWMDNILGMLADSGDLDELKAVWVKDSRWIRELP